MKKLLIIILLFATACSSSEVEEKVEEKEVGTYESILVKTNVLNKEADTYLVYLVDPAGFTPGEDVSRSAYSGPFETDENGEVEIPITTDYKISDLLSTRTDNKLRLMITTTEDVDIRNPLNELTIVEFVPDGEVFPTYFSTKKEFNLDIVDKYPDGVYSLKFPDAHCVIKLIIPEGYEADSSYEVAFRSYDDRFDHLMGIYNLGRIGRASHYWDTPFYEREEMANMGRGVVKVTKDQTIDIDYVNKPIVVNFDKDGNCIEGPIIYVELK